MLVVPCKQLDIKTLTEVMQVDVSKGQVYANKMMFNRYLLCERLNRELKQKWNQNLLLYSEYFTVCSETLPQIILFRHIHGALGLCEVPGVADMVAVDVGHEDAADDEGGGGTDADNRRIR